MTSFTDVIPMIRPLVKTITIKDPRELISWFCLREFSQIDVQSQILFLIKLILLLKVVRKLHLRRYIRLRLEFFEEDV